MASKSSGEAVGSQRSSQLLSVSLRISIAFDCGDRLHRLAGDLLYDRVPVAEVSGEGLLKPEVHHLLADSALIIPIRDSLKRII